MSPYLFILNMEAFSWLMKRAEFGRYISRWKIRGRGREGKEITYLLFAYDTVIFCEAKVINIKYLKWTLMMFKLYLDWR